MRAAFITAGAALCVIAVALWPRGDATPLAPIGASTAAAKSEHVSADPASGHGEARARSQHGATSRAVAPDRPGRPELTHVELDDADEEPEPELSLSADRVLARVNGEPLRLAQIQPLRAGAVAKRVSLRDLDRRMTRAIETELTFQAAAAAGIDVEARQQARLEAIRARHEKRAVSNAETGTRWSSVEESQLVFEARHATSLELQRELLLARDADEPTANGEDHAARRRALIDELWQAADVRQVSLQDSSAGAAPAP